MKRFFPKLTPKDIATLGLLVAVTALLAIFCTVRVGTLIKIPFKFISVFMAAVLFGPVYGGLCGAIGDLLNATLAPVGALLPQLTALEFVSGFTYGLFFLRRDLSPREYLIRTILCGVVQFLIDMFLTTMVLTSVGYFPSFEVAFSMRLPAGVLKFALQVLLIRAIRPIFGKIKL